MNLNYVENCALASPVLAIEGGKKIYETTAPFQAKADGLISAPLASGTNCPTLVGVLREDGTVAGNLAAKGVRTYTLIGKISRDTSAISLRWVTTNVDSDVFTLGKMSQIAKGTLERNEFYVGYCTVLNGAVTAWIPGTTDLDAASVDSFIVNQFGFTGM
jgi:hypothetical protein